jgi:uncharacterized protein YndB with AHSA1/START domain
MSDRIERELTVPATPDEVWEAVTGDGWLADEVEMTLEPGGEARFACGDSAKIGWVEDVRAPERLTFWWATDGETVTRVELTLEPRGDDATTLRVVETRPLDVLDLVGMPVYGIGGPSFGPVLVAA